MSRRADLWLWAASLLLMTGVAVYESRQIQILQAHLETAQGHLVDVRAELATAPDERPQCRARLSTDFAWELAQLFHHGVPNDEFDTVMYEGLKCISANEANEALK